MAWQKKINIWCNWPAALTSISPGNRWVLLIITPGNIPMHAWSSFVPYARLPVAPLWSAPAGGILLPGIRLLGRAAAGFRGVINVIHGGRNINKEILSQPEIKGVGFIGSNRAGHELLNSAVNWRKPLRSAVTGKTMLWLCPMPISNNMLVAVKGMFRYDRAALSRSG